VVRAFLFDVDGTLLTARGAGREALAAALSETFGATGPIERYDLRGKTDARIVADLMRAAGLADDAVEQRLDRCFQAYARKLQEAIGDGSRVQVMPGVPEIVAALGGRRDAVVGLLTGNIEAGARIKLQPTGLLPHFRVGAYGSDHADRGRLPHVAAERIRQLTGRAVPFEDMVIIGDTPLDIACAHACGALAVAVATGQYLLEDLAACGPDHLFQSFSDVPAALDKLTRP
jgi:phosphoglycolate phosphatase-like HAD superfamily hydrolase